MNQITVLTNTTEETISLGRKIGSNLKGGEIIELISDLGGGKTTITKGIAKGAGSPELVASPSFTICNEYKCPQFKIYHFDFYRLNDPGIVKRELAEVIDDSANVVILEWPEAVENVIPQTHLTIQLEAADKDSRKLTIKYTKDLEYAVKGIK